MKSDIFLSYAREDSELAARLVQHLEAHGWEVFWDVEIPAGHDFRDELEAELSSCGCVVVMWTRASIASRWVKREASWADNHDCLVPVLLDGVSASDLPFGFQSIQAVDLRDWTGDGDDPRVAALLDAVAATLARRAAARAAQEKDAEIPKESPEARPKSRRRTDPSSSTKPAILSSREGKPQRGQGLLARWPSLGRWGFPQIGLVVLVMATALVGWLSMRGDGATRPEFDPGPQPSASGRDGVRGRPCRGPLARIDGGGRVETFCLQTHEVTTRDYLACADAGTCPEASSVTTSSKSFCNAKDRDHKHDHPINCVSWHGAERYCASKGWRLPADAEWAWAAQGGQENRHFPWGDELPDHTRANACGGEWSDDRGRSACKSLLYDASDGYAATAPVGRYRTGFARWKLGDMAGNVAEWTATAHLASFRFIRGGSFVSSSADDLKVAARQWRNPEQGDNWLGFRCATSPP